MVAVPNLPEGETAIDADGPRLRLIICKTCNSIEPLPWFDGPVEYDDTLNHRLANHKFPSGEAHIGAPMFTVSEASWNDDSLRKRILSEISAATKTGAEGLGQTFYDLRSTFQEDALTCWKQHGRTTNCADYRSESKRLTPYTRADRKELGLEQSERRRPGTSLCVFCPYHSVVMERARKEQGFY
jgi:hypothetical protein